VTRSYPFLNGRAAGGAVLAALVIVVLILALA